MTAFFIGLALSLTSLSLSGIVALLWSHGNKHTQHEMKFSQLEKKGIL